MTQDRDGMTPMQHIVTSLIIGAIGGLLVVMVVGAMI